MFGWNWFSMDIQPSLERGDRLAPCARHWALDCVWDDCILSKIGLIGRLTRWLESSYFSPVLLPTMTYKTPPWRGVTLLEIHMLDYDLELLLLTCGPSALWTLLMGEKHHETDVMSYVEMKSF